MVYPFETWTCDEFLPPLIPMAEIPTGGGTLITIGSTQGGLPLVW